MWNRSHSIGVFLTDGEAQSISDCLHWFNKDQKLVQAGMQSYSHGFLEGLRAVLSPVDSCLRRQRLFKIAFTELFRGLGTGISEDAGLFQDDVLERVPLVDGSEQERKACKIAILVVDHDSVRCVRLRSYSSRMDGSASVESPSILVATLATIAVSLEMPPVAFNGRKFVSAYYGYVNPSKEAYDEATRIWGVDAVKTVVSLGCSKRRAKENIGMGLPGLNHSLSTVQHIGHLASDPERVTEELYRDSRITGFSCARFDGPDSLKEIDASSWDCVTYIEQTTKVYVELADIKSKLKACAQNLLTSADKVEFDSVKGGAHPEPPFLSSSIPRTEDKNPSLNPDQYTESAHLLTGKAGFLQSVAFDKSYVTNNILFDTMVSSNDLQRYG